MSVAIETTVEAPFLGLRYFDEEHAHLFFGRDVQVNDILEKLRRSRLVTVMGSSGSGKSSLVRAGVVPRLKAGLLDATGSRWRIAKMRPGSSPIASLARELEKALSAPELEVTLRRGPLGLVQAVEECRLPAGEVVLVIADQFEEIFRYQRESAQPEQAKEEAAAFVKLLLEATAQQAVPIYVVVTMRSDYLGNCVQFRDLPERINDGLYLVPRMRRDQLEQAIVGPLAVADVDIATRLVQKLLNDTGDDPDQLPVLQHVLLRTWNSWSQAARPLDLEDLDAVGGMKDSLSRHADEIFEALSVEQQRIARVLFQQLSDRDADGREIRRPAPVAVVAAVAGASVRDVEEVVDRFASPSAALVYRNEDGDSDITHESLIRKWSRIQGSKQTGGDAKGWMQKEIEARDQFLSLVERAAKNDTLMGRALDDAIQWQGLRLSPQWAKHAARSRVADTALHDVLWFIWECQSKETSRRRSRRRLLITALAALVLFIVVSLASLALWRSAERQRVAADDATRRARAAVARSDTLEAGRLISEGRPSFALAHLARAMRFAPEEIAASSWVSDLVLRRMLWMPTTVVEHTGIGVWSSAFSPDGRRIVTASRDNRAQVWDSDTGQLVVTTAPHDDLVTSAAFSPNGLRMVTASRDGTARVWDSATGRPVAAPLQHQKDVQSALFSPDGYRILTASADTTAQVWDAATGRPLGAPFRHAGAVASATFSPDGRRIVTTSYDNTARVWNSSNGQPVGASLRHQKSINSAVFSPDGHHIVTASFDGTARVWIADTGQPVGAPLQHNERVVYASFSPDGHRVVTASDDNTARVWNASTGRPVGAALQHIGAVNCAVFSPDGRLVVTASDDNSAQAWDAGTGQRVGAPLQHHEWVMSAMFSPDGSRILTASYDDKALLWNAAYRQRVNAPLKHGRSVGYATFSSDGRSIVTASMDHTAQVWDAATSERVGTPLQHDAGVISAAFSPDGRRIVSASSDNTARVWDIATSRPLGAPLQHQHIVTSATFSADGRYIVTASEDKTARVWEAATGKPVSPPLQHLGEVDSAAFSPDGRHIVTASGDGTARVWDAITGQPTGSPPRDRSVFVFAGFSPDGRRILTVSFMGAARVWDAATGDPVGSPLKHQGRIVSAAFSPDGRRIVTASLDNTARVWDAATGQPVGAPLQHQNLVASAAFSPDGRLIVTASWDNTARVWDAVTGQAAGMPVQHAGWVASAAFSPDGRRIVTASSDNTARVWDVMIGSGSEEGTEPLADLAEVVGGYRVTDLGSLLPLENSERLQRVRRLLGPQATGHEPFETLIRRFQPAPP